MKVLLCFLLTGCVVLPVTRTSTIPADTEVKTVHVGDHGVRLATATTAGSIVIRAHHYFDCENQTLQVSRVVVSKGARLGGTDDPRGRVFGLLLSPLTIPISAVITGLIVGTFQPTAERKTSVISTTRAPCVVAEADRPVLVELPSGEVLERTTDAAGEVRFLVPDDEPYAGTVTARVGRETATIAYVRGDATMTALDTEVRTCATKHDVHGSLAMRIAVGPNGMPSNVGFSIHRDVFARCVADAIEHIQLGANDVPMIVRFRLR